MFNNRFNSSKNDPLVEAVKQAQAEGDLRRQAIAFVNEQFGVFSRNAVVREDLAAYDAAIEEAVKCMKEGKPNDGNLANNYPPYDKVTRGDVVAGALGKDQMGGKKKKMEEKKMWEGQEDSSSGLPPSAAATQAAKQTSTPASTPKKVGNAAGSTISNARDAAGMNEAQLDELTGKGRLPALRSAYRDIKKTHSNEADWHAARADRAERRGESKKAEHHMDAGYGHEEKAERAGSKLKRADALQTRAKAAADIKASKAASKSARAEYKEEVMKESIIAKLFAKHMEEQVGAVSLAGPKLSSFGSAFAAARKSGQSNFSFGGKSFNTKLASSSPAKSATPTMGRTPEAAAARTSGSSLPSMASSTPAAKAAPAPVGKRDFASTLGRDVGSAPTIKPDAPKPSIGKNDFATTLGRSGVGNDSPAPKPAEPAPTSTPPSTTPMERGGSSNPPGASSASTATPPSGGAITQDAQKAQATTQDAGTPKPSARLQRIGESVNVGSNKYRIV